MIHEKVQPFLIVGLIALVIYFASRVIQEPKPPYEMLEICWSYMALDNPHPSHELQKHLNSIILGNCEEAFGKVENSTGMQNAFLKRTKEFLDYTK